MDFNKDKYDKYTFCHTATHCNNCEASEDFCLGREVTREKLQVIHHLSVYHYSLTGNVNYLFKENTLDTSKLSEVNTLGITIQQAISKVLKERINNERNK